jgi:tRNA1(Val) A37 N6-methylase TrmN6
LRIEPFGPDDLTQDAFLGGRVRLRQPARGYRAGIDPVLLAATVPARKGQAVLDMGCGAGAALCCLGARVPGLRLAGIELQPGYAALARGNLLENAQHGTVWEGDLAVPPSGMHGERFDFVIANPPYFAPGSRSVAPDPGREVALAGATPLAEWVSFAARRLKPKGWAHVVLRVERVPELMAAMCGRLGSLELWPLAPREGRAPRLVLVRARKEGRAPFRMHAALALHRGANHECDAEDYTPPVAAAVRAAAALSFPA